MSGGEKLTEREFEDALRTFQALWEAKADLERQLGDEQRRTEKLRNQIADQVVAQEALREELRAAQRTADRQEQRAGRDRETILSLEQKLVEAQGKNQREWRCERCIELETKVRALEHDNGQLKRAALELESLRAYGKELQDFDSASQVPSLAAPCGAPLSPAVQLSHRDSAFTDAQRVKETKRDGPAAASSLPQAGTTTVRSRLKLSKKHRSDQFESLGSEQQDGQNEPEPTFMPRKKRCVSPTFDETEQQLSQPSQPSQPSQSLQPGVETPALLGDEDGNEDDEPTSRWSSTGVDEIPDTTACPEKRPERDRPTTNGLLAADDSQLLETVAQEDSVADLLDEIAQPARSGSKEREKENSLPTRAPSSFNVSRLASSAVIHGCDERTAANASRTVVPGAEASAVVTGAAPKPAHGTASPVPPLATSQTQQLTQNSPDLFPEEDGDTTTSVQANDRANASSNKFKVKLRARTPFTQSQRS